MKTNNPKDKKDKKKKREKSLENYIFFMMQQSLKAALDAAVDELLKDWE